MSADRELLEALSDKVRRGEPIAFLDALAVCAYQTRLREDREAARKAFWSGFWRGAANASVTVLACALVGSLLFVAGVWFSEAWR